ncbi:DEAD/DEAH box helicase [Virgibacillus sp. YIM 98842]|uniref:DEAD/DEAH box helicase n=1 Tax=Virgibacillus sp. YIM 98842 TaxID=2663533 RepID=UPI0013D8EB5F|nr:DEAD/DEAH box helicase [Virgibacillus sp. YIM 98842]
MKKQTFEAFSFHPFMHKAIRKLNFQEPTEIQAKVIPAILNRESVIGKSRTGSGKTHAFLLPLVNQLNPEKDHVQFVITAPTRELATQLYDELKKIIQYAETAHQWKMKLLTGGTDKQRMMEKLKSQPHIIVGTPGRILDLVKEEALSIFKASSFVIDEADLMLDLGFIQEVDQLLVRSNQDIQLLVFSATIPEKLEHFLKKYLRNPTYVKIEEHFSPEKMEHRLIALKHREEADIINEISKAINPYLAIIFTNGKEQANVLSAALQAKGLNAGLIHGGLAPRERKRVLKDIQNLRYQYIVATDLAARGIDIKGVSHVINAQLPKEAHFYIHRVGRTARAGLEGTAISLYNEEDLHLIEKLELKGLKFTYMDVRNGEWHETKPWNKRAHRTNVKTDLDKEAWKRVRKQKKVKPGYKKKMKQQQSDIKRKLSKKNKFRK